MAGGAQQVPILCEKIFIGRTMGVMAERAVLKHKFFVNKCVFDDIGFMAPLSKTEKQCFWHAPFFSGYGMTCLASLFT